MIFDIQRFSVHDGPGIRTLVFMKGCPLACPWCSNPESQNSNHELIHASNKCIECNRCIGSCSQKAIDPISYIINREKCNMCGNCVNNCPVNAKKIIGYKMNISELIDKIEQDSAFYKSSNGGVTIGGGEPSLQSNYVSKVLDESKKHDIHTCVETCGFAETQCFKQTIANADLILYDIKHMNSKKHQQCIGVPNDLILENARIASNDKKIIFRVPLIPGFNDDKNNLEKTVAFAESLKGTIGVEFLPYHSYGREKYEWLGREYSMDDTDEYTLEKRNNLQKYIEERESNIKIKLV